MLSLVLMVLVTVADQLTKEWIRSGFVLHQSVPVFDGYFNFTYVRNTGAAWGMFGGQNIWLSVLSVVMLALMIVYRRSFLTDSVAHRVALGLMAGGIIGNLLDRVRLGWVTDFLDFYVGSSHWPAFNIADASICVGVGIYILTSLRATRTPPTKGT